MAITKYNNVHFFLTCKWMIWNFKQHGHDVHLLINDFKSCLFKISMKIHNM
jgi:predicted glycosyltransferase